MKKLMYFAAALLVLVGCNKNSQENKENAPQNLVTITGGIDFKSQQGPNKVAAKEGWETASSVEFVWEVGDEIAVLAVYMMNYGGKLYPIPTGDYVKFVVSKILDDGKTAEFTGEPLSGGMETYLVYYPYEYGEVSALDEYDEWRIQQQYTGKFRPRVSGLGNNNTFSLDQFNRTLDLPLIGNVTLGKIEYWVKGVDKYNASLSMGEGGLQLTNTPQHVTIFFSSYSETHGFVLKFYDTNNQLIMEKESKANIWSQEDNKIISLPTLEVKAAN